MLYCYTYHCYVVKEMEREGSLLKNRMFKDSSGILNRDLFFIQSFRDFLTPLANCTNCLF